MAAITWSDVEALQASLSSVSNTAQTLFLALANDLNAAAFGGEDSSTYALARAAYAAHLGELEHRNGALSVSSETIGTTSITLAYAASEAGLKTTAWGQVYLELLDASPLRLGLTTGPACR